MTSSAVPDQRTASERPSSTIGLKRRGLLGCTEPGSSFCERSVTARDARLTWFELVMSRVQQSVSFFVLNANNPRSAFPDAAVRRGNVTSAARFIDLGLSQIKTRAVHAGSLWNRERSPLIEQPVIADLSQQLHPIVSHTFSFASWDLGGGERRCPTGSGVSSRLKYSALLPSSCSTMAMCVIGRDFRDAIPMLLTWRESDHATRPNLRGTKAEISPSVPLPIQP